LLLTAYFDIKIFYIFIYFLFIFYNIINHFSSSKGGELDSILHNDTDRSTLGRLDVVDDKGDMSPTSDILSEIEGIDRAPRGYEIRWAKSLHNAPALKARDIKDIGLRILQIFPICGITWCRLLRDIGYETV